MQMRKKYGFQKKFGRKYLGFPLPACYDEEAKGDETDFKERLEDEKLVYEIEILDIVEREELYFEQGVYKYPITKPNKSEKREPTDLDSVIFDITVKQKVPDDQT